jgi:acetyl-CoA carboxylase carboxyl transferase subunit alpha
MLENAIYSVISPESCAAIVWRDAGRAALAAEALKLTASDLVRLGLVDEIVPEPSGGAHTNPDLAADLLGDALRRALDRLCPLSPAELVAARHARFRQMGNFFA